MNSRVSRASVCSSMSPPPVPGKRSPKVLDPRSLRSTGASSESSPELMRRARRTFSTESFERRGHLAVGRLAAHLLGEEALRARHLDEGGILVERDAHAAGLLGEGLEDRLPHPPDGVGDELHAVVGVELPDRLEQPLVPDGDELGEVEPVALVLLHVGNDEAEIGRDQSLGRLLVARPAPAAPAAFPRRGRRSSGASGCRGDTGRRPRSALRGRGPWAWWHYREP